MNNQYAGVCGYCGTTVAAGCGRLEKISGKWVVFHQDGACPEISSGLGIGGAGSDDYNIHTNGDQLEATYFPEPGEYFEPTGTTRGIYTPGERCHCGKPGNWNPGAGQTLCDRHWDEY